MSGRIIAKSVGGMGAVVLLLYGNMILGIILCRGESAREETVLQMQCLDDQMSQSDVHGKCAHLGGFEQGMHPSVHVVIAIGGESVYEGCRESETEFSKRVIIACACACASVCICVMPMIIIPFRTVEGGAQGTDGR